MFKFLKTPEGLFITAIILLLIVVLISYNRNTIMGWFSKTEGRYVAPSTSKKQCLRQDATGCQYLGLYVDCNECSKRGIVIV